MRFKRVIMDDAGLLPKSRAPKPPVEPHYKRVVFCSGKARRRPAPSALPTLSLARHRSHPPAAL